MAKELITYNLNHKRMEDLIMKKLLMFVMVLAIAAPAGALKYEPHVPDFAGCENSGQVLWEFTEDGCLPTSDVVDPYYFNPDLPNPMFGMRYSDGAPAAWDWSAGVYTVNSEEGLNCPIGERGGKQYLRMYFEVVHTLVESNDPSLIGFDMELWDMQDWPGCPEPSYEYGQFYGGLAEGINFPPPTETFDVENGWWQSYWVADVEPADAITHVNAIIGMDDHGAVGFAIQEVYMNYIWFNEDDGSDIPEHPCVIVPPLPTRVVVIDANDMPVYEPQDMGPPPGPPPMGPTDGQMQVRLAWQPGDPCYPAFTAIVIVDPNIEGDGPHEDFIFTNGTEPNGIVTLTFNETNWNQYQNVFVEATGDLLREGEEFFDVELTITIDIADPNFGEPGSDPVVVSGEFSIIDNDIPYISFLPRDALLNVLTENNPGVPECINITLSHIPNDDVEVRAVFDFEAGGPAFEMVVMDPNFEDWTDPNHLLFTSVNYFVPQQICLEAIDDDEVMEVGLELVPGQIILEALSDDIRYWTEPEDLGGEGGELTRGIVGFNVEDNDCGAWGYDAVDHNEDCRVGLADFAHFFAQWPICTEPYDADTNQWGDCGALWKLVVE